MVYTHHIFFIRSSVDGYLGCFRVLAVVNSAAVNMGVHISFKNNFYLFSSVWPCWVFVAMWAFL